MDPNQIQVWIGVATLLINAGTAGWKDIQGWIRTTHSATDAELNQVLEGVKQDASARQKLAEADSGQPQG